VIDLDRGWRTERLDLEPLAMAHAAELAPLLDAPGCMSSPAASR
jgi:hypothetical protein